MPEGDTIFRAARTLHRALAGRTVVRFESPLPALTRVHHDQPITGRTVEQVVARGKHILMSFSADRRMNPSESLWVYGRGGLPCRKCGEPIQARKVGLDARLTYWCRRCQKSG